jgi:Mce-associated membrane protein
MTDPMSGPAQQPTKGPVYEPYPGSADTGTTGTGTARFTLCLSPSVGVAVATVLVVAVVAAVTFGVLLAHRSAADRAGTEALATARAYAVTATSYGYQHLDKDLAAMLDGATGDYKNEYASATNPLRQLVIQAKVTSAGTVVAAGIQSQRTDEVVVVVLVDQSITNVTSPQPRTEYSRMIMILVPSGGRWLVSKLDTV